MVKSNINVVMCGIYHEVRIINLPPLLLLSPELKDVDFISDFRVWSLSWNKISWSKDRGSHHQDWDRLQY